MTTAPSAALSVLEAHHGLDRFGYVRLAERFTAESDAWAASRRVLAEAAHADALCLRMPMMVEVGAFTIPPPGMTQRDFQALHIDFGIPVGTRAGADVARYTALFVEPELNPSGAQTRLVPLSGLLRQREWPSSNTLRRRLVQRFKDETREGILARILEAADVTSDLPDKHQEGFLCGMEFATLAQEEEFFEHHGVPLRDVEQRVTLEPGEVLILDNLSCAHGRVGRRRSEELHQLCTGFRGVKLADQLTVFDYFLSRFIGTAASR